MVKVHETFVYVREFLPELLLNKQVNIHQYDQKLSFLNQLLCIETITTEYASYIVARFLTMENWTRFVLAFKDRPQDFLNETSDWKPSLSAKRLGPRSIRLYNNVFGTTYRARSISANKPVRLVIDAN
jgi:hypothetical protein